MGLERKAALIAAAVLASACVAARSPRAAAIEESDEHGIAGCKFLATVEGASLIGGVSPVGTENAMTDVRERASAIGANRILVSSVAKVATGGTVVMARAYSCPG